MPFSFSLATYQPLEPMYAILSSLHSVLIVIQYMKDSKQYDREMDKHTSIYLSKNYHLHYPDGDLFCGIIFYCQTYYVRGPLR